MCVTLRRVFAARRDWLPFRRRSNDPYAYTFPFNHPPYFISPLTSYVSIFPICCVDWSTHRLFFFTRKKKEYPFPRLPSDWGKPLMTHRRKSNKRKNLELSRFIVSPLPHIFNRRLKLVPRDYWREQFACNLQNRPLNRTTKNRKRKGKGKKRSPVSFSVRFFFSIPNSNSTFTRRFSILALLHRPSS